MSTTKSEPSERVCNTFVLIIRFTVLARFLQFGQLDRFVRQRLIRNAAEQIGARRSFVTDIPNDV